MQLKLDHVGIVVHDLDRAIATYEAALGVQCERELLPERHLEVAFFAAGESRIELITPTSPESAVSRFLEKRGEGLHHLAYEVDDIAAALERARQAGLRLIDQEARPGAHGAVVAFVHPASLHGVLTEFVQKVHPH
ncbi:MAG: methylmalonyl-CoA epimerase [Chloroflexia bacterium]|nr:methylmalonyl-CoA epimerase [Chloroflexia bacterium]